MTGIREDGRLLKERQLAVDRITALAEELELLELAVPAQEGVV